MYCTDTDLLRWEPELFTEAEFASQTLLVANGALAGPLLRLDGDAWFDVANVRAGHIALVEADGVTRALPLLSIDSPRIATISPRVRRPTEQRVHVTVRTFAAQRRIAGEILTRMAGVDAQGGRRVIDRDLLRRPCVLATLHLIYSALSTSAVPDDVDLVIRMQLYARLYRQSLDGLIVEIGSGERSEASARRPLRLVRFPADRAVTTTRRTTC